MTIFRNFQGPRRDIGIARPRHSKTCLETSSSEVEDGNARIKKDISHEHHLTFTQESGNGQGSYLTQRVVPLIGATRTVLANVSHSVLREFDSTESLRAVLVRQHKHQYRM